MFVVRRVSAWPLTHLQSKVQYRHNGIYLYNSIFFEVFGQGPYTDISAIMRSAVVSLIILSYSHPYRLLNGNVIFT